MILGIRDAALMAAACAGLCATAAHAETITSKGPMPRDPIMEQALQLQPTNQFTLNSQQDVDLVQFHHERTISVCAPHVDHDQLDAARRAVPIIVTADGEQHTVTPGNCIMLDAKKVSVKPAGSLGNNTDLVGTVRAIP